MICEIICVGTELLLGDIVNTDGAFLARELAAMGFASYHQTTVGDNGDRLREAVRTALSRADLLILTGGLGPTCDDITKSVTAEVFGKPLRMNEDIRRGLEAFFRERFYRDNVPAIYPEDAMALNTGIMVRLLGRELLNMV